MKLANAINRNRKFRGSGAEGPAVLTLPIQAKPEFGRNQVPKGRLNLAQDASPGFILEHDSVPKGRLKLCQNAHKPSS
jgi:hypothetical protein